MKPAPPVTSIFRGFPPLVLRMVFYFCDICLKTKRLESIIFVSFCGVRDAHAFECNDLKTIIL